MTSFSRAAWRALLVAIAVALSPSLLAQSPPSYVFSGPLLPLIVQAPSNTWLQVNANLYSNVWTPDYLRPLFGTEAPFPSKIIQPWSSFAWDSNRGDLILWGGGHANYPGNDVYRWHASTLLWERASYPSEIKTDPLLAQIAIDGVDNAPISSHTYKNQQFLPIVDRFVTFGGAAFNYGGPFIRPLESAPTTQTRLTGPYLFDPNRADGNKVGGTTGSNVQRVTGTAIIGGQMWQNRDIHKWLAGQPLPGTHVDGCTSYAKENNRDVVYIASAPRYSTTLDLYRYQLTTLSDPSQDLISKVGAYGVGTSGQTTCGYDPVHKLFVRTGTNSIPFQFWDLTTPGASNFDKNVQVNASIASLQTWMSARSVNIQNCGLEYDPTRVTFLLWCGAADIWEIAPPASGNTVSGWTATQRPTPPQPAPLGIIDTGVMGKWRHLPYYDVFVGLQESNEGQIWIYKPNGWVQPNVAGNALPSVAVTSPAPGLTVPPATNMNLTASASDSDGTIVRVEWWVNGSKIGQSTSAPYTFAYAPIPVGSYSVVALAVDNAGGMTASAPVVFNVAATLTTVTLQRGLSGYAGATDTFLDAFRPTTILGAATPLWLNLSSYRPLVRFAIFQSEGGPVPNGAIVQSATLSLYKQYYDDDYQVNALLKAWGESEATWNQSRSGVNWTAGGAGAAGTDYVAAPDDVVPGAYTPGWVAFDVTTRVRQWSSNPGPNFGWRVSQAGTTGTDKQINSSEFTTDTTLRPKLVVVYSIPANVAPTVTLTAPAAGASITLGQSFTLTATATDSDGTVARVDFYANGVFVGSDMTAPYSIAWTPAASGSYTLTAIATDNANASGTSAGVPVTVTSGSGTTTISLQQGVSGYAGASDTFLDNYLQTTPRDDYAQLWQNRFNYTPLLRFKIFQSEGGPVPNGATIQSATLSLYKQYYDDTFGVYAILVPWTSTQATWLSRQTGVPWNAPGATGAGTDYNSTADALVVAPFNPGWLNFDVTARVAQWSANAAANFGWRVAQTSTVSQDRQFNSSEWSDATQRPKLVIVYGGGAPANQPPTVSLTSPGAGATIALAQSFTLTASASDADGSVVRVDFYANGLQVGSDTTAPYSFTWTPGASGNYALKAIATDNQNAQTTSAIVNVVVNPATIVLQQGNSGYAGAADTFLDNYLQTTARGSSTLLWQSRLNYVPLVRFAIFQSEGGPVPNGAIVQSATLSLYKQYYADTYLVHALLKPWVQSQATWWYAQTGSAWSVGGANGAGSDYVSTPDASVAGGFNPGWLNFDVTTRVSQWSANAATNYGWRLSQQSMSANEKQFNSSEYAADATLRPKLTVTIR